MILLIILITLPIAAHAIPFGVIATVKFFSKIGALEERSYYEIIWLQILKTLREKKNAVRDVLMLSNVILAEIKLTMSLQPVDLSRARLT